VRAFVESRLLIAWTELAPARSVVLRASFSLASLLRRARSSRGQRHSHALGALALTDRRHTFITGGGKMRLYSGKIPVIGAEIVKSLMESGDIEVIDRAEAELDVQAVLKEYLRLDKELTDRAKDVLQKRSLPHEQFGKVKRALAGEKGFGLGDEGLDWMTNQMIESFMASPHVEEIFVEDSVLRRRMADILKKHMLVEDELDEEVRRRIKNLEEGTSTWDIEYQKALDQIKRNRGLG
jgi:uncharacterized protein